jgi:hypothetical protein
MPRTWSYRKREYTLVRPQVKRLSGHEIGLIVLYGIMGIALTIGMSFALTHKIAESNTTPGLMPSSHGKVILMKEY